MIVAGTYPTAARDVAAAVADPVAQVAAVTGAARAAQAGWARRPVRDRARVLLRLHDLVLDGREALRDAVSEATGKGRRDAFLEVVACALVLRYYGTAGPRLLRPRHHRATGVFTPGLTSAVERRVPAGVVADIPAWNYPLVFLLADAAPALLAGNAVVLKPDPRSDGVARAVLDLAAAAGVPDGLLGAVHGGSPELSGALVDAADHVLFTGSTRVGRLVAERAARSLTGMTLELGGKNPAYVADDADVPAAAAALVRDCFSAAGQTCTATERVYVHEAVHDAFVERFAAATRALRVGGDPDADVGRLTTPEHAARVGALVDDAVDSGARVLAGGRSRPDLGPAYYEPTVLVAVPPHAAAATDEVFGPVVAVHAVAGDAEALERMNEGDAGLTAAVWTRDVARGRHLAAAVRAGTVVVNETYHLAWGSPGLPLGGVGSSGLGRRFGADGLREVTRAHVTVVQRGRVVPWLVDRPAEQTERILTGLARTMRALGRP